MTTPRTATDLALPPEAAWPLRRKLDAVTRFHLGGEWMRDEVGPVGYLALGPEHLGPRLAPRFVLVSSAQGAHDALAGFDGSVDKYGAFHEEFRKLGTNIFNMAHDEWVPRKRALQPAFTKQRMTGYAGAMSAVAVETAADWAARGRVDVQAATRALTTEVLGRALLGLPLGERAGRSPRTSTSSRPTRWAGPGARSRHRCGCRPRPARRTAPPGTGSRPSPTRPSNGYAATPASTPR